MILFFRRFPEEKRGLWLQLRKSDEQKSQDTKERNADVAIVTRKNNLLRKSKEQKKD